jgi:peptidoglycan/xylan/chitin deacetylase (PgdA/CDA1 family)
MALWVASLAGMVLLGRSVWLGPPPLIVSALALFGYLALVVTGVLIPQLEMYGDCLWQGRRDTGCVALTFDDGPDPTTTRRVLQILSEHGAHATFFVIGEKAARYPDVIREIVEAGHAIGVHGYSHDRLYALKSPAGVERDLRQCREAVRAAADVSLSWFRPPIGQVSPRTAAGARRANLELVAWSVRGLDGLRAVRPEQVVRRIGPRLQAGAIVLLHDSSERGDFTPASIEALPAILRLLSEKGLRPSRLEALL